MGLLVVNCLYFSWYLAWVKHLLILVAVWQDGVAVTEQTLLGVWDTWERAERFFCLNFNWKNKVMYLGIRDMCNFLRRSWESWGGKRWRDWIWGFLWAKLTQHYANSRESTKAQNWRTQVLTDLSGMSTNLPRNNCFCLCQLSLASIIFEAFDKLLNYFKASISKVRIVSTKQAYFMWRKDS